MIVSRSAKFSVGWAGLRLGSSPAQPSPAAAQQWRTRQRREEGAAGCTPGSQARAGAGQGRRPDERTGGRAGQREDGVWSGSDDEDLAGVQSAESRGSTAAAARQAD
ncbi:unnamed protein product [Calypogeia fissa]